MTQEFKQGTKVPHGCPWHPVAVCGMECVHFPVRGYRPCVRFQGFHGTEEEEESLMGALFSILYLLPSLGSFLLILLLKIPLFSSSGWHLLSASCLSFTVGCLERVAIPTVFMSSLSVTSQHLGLLFHSAKVALLKMTCAYSSHGPVTDFHSSPYLFFSIWDYCPWSYKTFSWSSELLPPLGPFPLVYLILLLAPLSPVAECRFSITFCYQAPYISVFFSLAVSSRPVYV